MAETQLRSARLFVHDLAATHAFDATPAPPRQQETPMIRGMHAMFYSSEAAALRAFIRDQLGWTGNDVGDGWVIFDTPEADLGVHPTQGLDVPSGTAELSFYCDDIHATMAALRGRGVAFLHEPENHGYGWVTHMQVPGGFKVQLYQPLYKK